MPGVSNSVLYSSPEDGFRWGLALQTPANSPAAASKLMWVKKYFGKGNWDAGDNLAGHVKLGNSQKSEP